MKHVLQLGKVITKEEQKRITGGYDGVCTTICHTSSSGDEFWCGYGKTEYEALNIMTTCGYYHAYSCNIYQSVPGCTPP